MPSASRLPALSAALGQRLVDAERDCMADWLRAMEAEPGNPYGIAIRTFGRATALVCSAIPAEVFNRVIGLTPEDYEQIPAIVDFYRERGARPLFDLSPYIIPPFWVEPNITLVLARHGFYQGAFHQMLYGVPTTNISLPAADVAIAEVRPEDADTFVRVYEQVWDNGGAIRVLIGRPQFRCYLAYVASEPAALGVLHIANGAGTMANALTVPALRGRGCQTALLYWRMREAALAGCDLLVSQCMPGSVSQDNQLRVGFRIAGSKAWWIPIPA